MSAQKKGPSVLRTVLVSVLGAFAVPLALSLGLRIFYCYACNHFYTLSEESLNAVWYVSDVLSEMGLFFGIGLIIAGMSQKIKLSWLAIPMTVVYAAVTPIMLYTAEYASNIFLSEQAAEDGLMAATSTLETYYIYIIISLVVLFVFITAHGVRENAGRAKLGLDAGFFSFRRLPAAVGYTVSALLLVTVVVTSIAIGNSFVPFLLSILIAVLRTVFIFLGIWAAGRKTDR